MRSSPTETAAAARAATRRRRSDFVLAAVLAAVAAAVSPPAIELLTGRPALNPRIETISLAFDLFLLILVAAALTRGRARMIAFHVAAWAFPLALLAGLEAAAVAVRLADRIAPTEDISILRKWQRWPAYLLSEERWAGPPGEVRLYRPWRGEGITINDHGLRTAPPTPKAPDEWRIAVTGGSTTWGWRVLDADTIPAGLQDALQRADPKVTVYNFGIEGAQINSELALLRRFRASYGIDQVIFYTGGNDVIGPYLRRLNDARGFGWLTAEATAFELVKAMQRWLALSREPSPQQLADLDNTVLAPLLRGNSLRDGIRAANAYCELERLRCDFVVQPMIFTRHPLRGSEAALLERVDRLYPQLGLLNKRMYQDALASGVRVHDFGGILDTALPQFFSDLIHVNQAGNRFIAERIAATIAARRPPRP